MTSAIVKKHTEKHTETETKSSANLSPAYIYEFRAICLIPAAIRMSLSGNNIVEQQKQQQQQQQCDAGDDCACTASLDAKWCGCVLALRTPHQRQLSRAIPTFNYYPIPIRILFPRIQSAAQTYLSKQHSVAKKLVFYYTNCDRGCVNFVLYGLCLSLIHIWRCRRRG